MNSTFCKKKRQKNMSWIWAVATFANFFKSIHLEMSSPFLKTGKRKSEKISLKKKRNQDSAKVRF